MIHNIIDSRVYFAKYVFAVIDIWISIYCNTYYELTNE